MAKFILQVLVELMSLFTACCILPESGSILECLSTSSSELRDEGVQVDAGNKRYGSSSLHRILRVPIVALLDAQGSCGLIEAVDSFKQ